MWIVVSAGVPYDIIIIFYLTRCLFYCCLWLVGYFRDECFVLIPGGLWTVVVDDGYLSDHLHNKLATKDRKC